VFRIRPCDPVAGDRKQRSGPLCSCWGWGSTGSAPVKSVDGVVPLPRSYREGFLADEGPASAGKFDDVQYPAYSMGAAAEMLGVTPGFLRGLGEAGQVTPHRSDGGHRRYSRHQLQLAARARELVDEGMTLASACRIVSMEDQLGVARKRITELENATPAAPQASSADAARQQ